MSLEIYNTALSLYKRGLASKTHLETSAKEASIPAEKLATDIKSSRRARVESLYSGLLLRYTIGVISLANLRKGVSTKFPSKISVFEHDLEVLLKEHGKRLFHQKLIVGSFQPVDEDELRLLAEKGGVPTEQASAQIQSLKLAKGGLGRNPLEAAVGNALIGLSQGLNGVLGKS